MSCLNWVTWGNIVTGYHALAFLLTLTSGGIKAYVECNLALCVCPTEGLPSLLQRNFLIKGILPHFRCGGVLSEIRNVIILSKSRLSEDNLSGGKLTFIFPM